MQTDTDGTVNHGQPLAVPTLAGLVGLGESQARQQLNTLRAGGYVDSERSRTGLRIRLLPLPKFAGSEIAGPEIAGKPTFSRSPENRRSQPRDRRETDDLSGPDPPDRRKTTDQDRRKTDDLDDPGTGAPTSARAPGLSLATKKPRSFVKTLKSTTNERTAASRVVAGGREDYRQIGGSEAQPTTAKLAAVGLATAAADDEAGLAVLLRELEARSASADAFLAELVMRQAREMEMGVRPAAVAALLAVVVEPRGGIRSNGFYVAEIGRLMGTNLRAVLDDLEAGRVDARELMHNGRTKQIQTLACAWLDLASGTSPGGEKQDVGGEGVA